ncbi:TPA: mobilization protein [Enterobacter asburiae]|uniref:mobilization protein n=1 Tax=Gammaproteobacteria TaxID=1236 RepID=UPI0018F22E61|nr:MULTISPECIES: mobilization protein [Gammaproteobacteria]MBJ7583998.1 mobilization protein [Aeromonas veronii]QQM89055.1 mobilization protein [Klebsiella variicola]HCG3096939.1 mobilization protein [Klebsiella pneumoniae]
MAKAVERLAKLEEQRARINAEIQRVRAREQQQKRKEDTRRKVLVGAWMMAKVQSGEWPEQKLIEAMDSYLERDHDRALFGLPPKQPQPQQQPEHDQSGQWVQGGE